MATRYRLGLRALRARRRNAGQDPPPPRAARRVRSICRRSETAEDRNVVLQFANQGMRIFSPNVASALRTASGDIAAEGQAVRAATADQHRQPRHLSRTLPMRRRSCAELHISSSCGLMRQCSCRSCTGASAPPTTPTFLRRRARRTPWLLNHPPRRTRSRSATPAPAPRPGAVGCVRERIRSATRRDAPSAVTGQSASRPARRGIRARLAPDPTAGSEQTRGAG